jgi:hypothetical protein
MIFLKRLLNHGLQILNNNLNIFEKIIYSILCSSLIIVTVIGVIQSYPYWALLTGFVFTLIIYFYKAFITSKSNINTDGGNYNELIQGNYVQGDYNINIQGNNIDLNQDITQTIAKIQDILTQMVNQGYSTEEALNRITNDLLEVMKRQPKIKIRLFGDENINDSELIEELLSLLVDDNSYSNCEISDFSSFIENFNYHETVYYKGYSIYLEVDKDKCWHYRIANLLLDNTGESFVKYLAIDEAKGKIDQERFRNW